MQRLSLREAARLSGTNKSTILRAIQSGRLKAERTPSNEWSIEEAELRLVYPPLVEPVAPPQQPIEDIPLIVTNAPVAAPFAYVPVPDAVASELKALMDRCATLEEKLVVQTQKLAEMEAQRDQWKQRCAQLMVTVEAPQRHVAPRQNANGDGLFVFFGGIVALWLAVMAGAAAIVDNNENHEAPIALILAVIGIACCVYYAIRKKRVHSEAMAEL